MTYTWKVGFYIRPNITVVVNQEAETPDEAKKLATLRLTGLFALGIEPEVDYCDRSSL